MMLKFSTAVIIRVNRDLHDTHATDTINPQDFAINTTNIVSIQRTGYNTLVITPNAPLTYVIRFESESERDRIFNGLLHTN